MNKLMKKIVSVFLLGILSVITFSCAPSAPYVERKTLTASLISESTVTIEVEVKNPTAEPYVVKCTVKVTWKVEEDGKKSTHVQESLPEAYTIGANSTHKFTFIVIDSQYKILKTKYTTESFTTNLTNTKLTDLISSSSLAVILPRKEY